MKIRKYKLLFGVIGHRSGEIVYDYINGYSFSIAEDDERLFGIPHIVVTRNPKGGYPYFSVPAAYLEEIE